MLVSGSLCAEIATPPTDIERVTSVEGITEYRLKNGLVVLLFPDDSKPTITVNVTYLVGSRHENYGETGMAHLLEHLLFKGTPRNPDLDKQFNQRGARSNGTTGYDRTNYYEIIQASDANLKWAIDMEADRMVHSNITKKDLDSEMTVVRNEYELGENTPAAVLFKRMQSVAFDWHNYQKAPIGNRSDIENVGIENLQAFYRMYYQPDNAVLLIAGKFDEARALKLIAEAFGLIPRPARVLPKFWTVEPTQDGERTFTVRRKGDIQIVLASYKMPGALHPDAEVFSILVNVLGNTPSGRLHKVLVETGKAAGVGASGASNVDPGLVNFIAVVKKGESLEEAQKILLETVENFYKNPPTAEEMDRAKTLYAKVLEQIMNSPEALGVGMSEMIAQGDWRLFFQSRENIKQISSADVARVAQTYLKRDNRTVGQFIPTDDPQRAEIPPAPAASLVLKDFKPSAAVAAGEDFDPSPANLDARTRRSQFPGGMKVALLPKKTRGATVNVSIALHWGDEKSLFGKAAVAGFMGAMLSRGSKQYTREQLADQFNKLKFSGGVSGRGATFQTTREHLPAAIKLVAHVLKEPVFPAREFEQLKKQTLTGMEQGRSDPGALAGQALSRHFNSFKRGDWRYSSSIDESIEDAMAVTVDQLRAFHREFLGASHAEIAVVGDFDEKDVAALIKEHFDTWKSPRTYARIEMIYRDVPPVNTVIETPDKENAVFIARMDLKLGDDDKAFPEYPAIVLANYMLGGGAGMNSRLANRIRNREGLSYGVGTSLRASALDAIGTFSASASVAPQNMAKLENIFLEELDRALKEGFTAEEMANAKSGYLQSRQQSRTQDGAIASAWTDKLYRDKTFAESAEFDGKIAALTADEVLAAMRKHIDPAKLTIVKAGNFANVPK